MSDKSYLKELILLRNDPDKVAVIREAAQAGEVDAQYALGLVYAEGRGVPPQKKSSRTISTPISSRCPRWLSARLVGKSRT